MIDYEHTNSEREQIIDIHWTANVILCYQISFAFRYSYQIKNALLYCVVIYYLLLCSGDIELNPGQHGQVNDMISCLKICCSNIRSLKEEKLNLIQLELVPCYNIICLNETNLHPNRNIDFDLQVAGF